MNAVKQRIAIAEACGFTRCHYGVEGGIGCWDSGPEYWQGLKGKRFQALPDYLSDLNAMHEAEKVLAEDHFKRTDYTWELQKIVLGDNAQEVRGAATFQIIHATAAQRAEAFLRTIGKWEEAA